MLRAAKLLLVAAAAWFPAVHAYAEIADGFDSARQTKSRYFTIYLQGGIDAERLAMKIALPQEMRSIVASSSEFQSSLSFEDQIDVLYLAVSEILQAHMKNFESTAKVCSGPEGLAGVSRELFGRDIKTGGFYVVALDALYIDSENVSLYVLGHELAHAVISKYFVVPPPEKIQEVLAGYVEYELRKYSR